MSIIHRFGIFSIAFILLAVMLTADNREAQADCAPDPAVNGDTVTCTGTDTDGFQTDGVSNLTLEVVESGVVQSGIQVLNTFDSSISNFGLVDGLDGTALNVDEADILNSATGQIIGGIVVSGCCISNIQNFGLVSRSTGSTIVLGSFDTITNEMGAQIIATGDGNKAIVLGTNSGSAVTNKVDALISASGNDTNTILIEARDVVINNLGTIESLGTNAPVLNFSGLNETLVNSGLISAVGDGSNGVQVLGSIAITNSGTISATGVGASGLVLDGGGPIVLVNSGTIEGNAFAIFGESAVNFLDPAVTLTNSGSIIGNVLLGNSSDSVTIAGGTIDGDLILGDGEDFLIFDADMGSTPSDISGSIDAGGGDDTYAIMTSGGISITPALPPTFERFGVIQTDPGLTTTVHPAADASEFPLYLEGVGSIVLDGNYSSNLLSHATVQINSSGLTDQLSVTLNGQVTSNDLGGIEIVGNASLTIGAVGSIVGSGTTTGPLLSLAGTSVVNNGLLQKTNGSRRGGINISGPTPLGTVSFDNFGAIDIVDAHGIDLFGEDIFFRNHSTGTISVEAPAGLVPASFEIFAAVEIDSHHTRFENAGQLQSINMSAFFIDAVDVTLVNEASGSIVSQATDASTIELIGQVEQLEPGKYNIENAGLIENLGTGSAIVVQGGIVSIVNEATGIVRADLVSGQVAIDTGPSSSLSPLGISLINLGDISGGNEALHVSGSLLAVNSGTINGDIFAGGGGGLTNSGTVNGDIVFVNEMSVVRDLGGSINGDITFVSGGAYLFGAGAPLVDPGNVFANAGQPLAFGFTVEESATVEPVSVGGTSDFALEAVGEATVITINSPGVIDFGLHLFGEGSFQNNADLAGANASLTLYTNPKIGSGNNDPAFGPFSDLVRFTNAGTIGAPIALDGAGQFEFVNTGTLNGSVAAANGGSTLILNKGAINGAVSTFTSNTEITLLNGLDPGAIGSISDLSLIDVDRFGFFTEQTASVALSPAPGFALMTLGAFGASSELTINGADSSDQPGYILLGNGTVVNGFDLLLSGIDISIVQKVGIAIEGDGLTFINNAILEGGSELDDLISVTGANVTIQNDGTLYLNGAGSFASIISSDTGGGLTIINNGILRRTGGDAFLPSIDFEAGSIQIDKIADQLIAGIDRTLRFENHGTVDLLNSAGVDFATTGGADSIFINTGQIDVAGSAVEMGSFFGSVEFQNSGTINVQNNSAVLAGAGVGDNFIFDAALAAGLSGADLAAAGMFAPANVDILNESGGVISSQAAGIRLVGIDDRVDLPDFLQGSLPDLHLNFSLTNEIGAMISSETGQTISFEFSESNPEFLPAWAPALTVRFTLTNGGTVISHSNAAAISLQQSEGAENFLFNTGTIQSDGLSIDGSFGQAATMLTNSGSIIGGIALGENGDSVINSGTITGNILLGNGDDQLENLGTINGDVDLGDGGDEVINTASIAGQILLGDGDDLLTMTDTTVFTSFSKDGGAGTDTLVLSAAAGTSIDTLDSTSFTNFEFVEINGVINGGLSFPGTVDQNTTITVHVGAEVNPTGVSAISGSRIDLINLGTINGDVDLGDGNDSVTNLAWINGQVQLGAGDDLLTMTENTIRTTFTKDGGAGTDTLQLDVANGSFVNLDMTNFVNFETLAFNGNIDLGDNISATASLVSGATGFTSVTVTDGLFALLNSNLPDADVTFFVTDTDTQFSFLDLGNSTVKSITGSDGSDFVTLDGTVLNNISLGAGRDQITWDPFGSVGGIIDGGADTDLFFINNTGAAEVIDFANILNFELLEIAGSGAITIENASGLTDITVNTDSLVGSSEGHLTILNSLLPDASVVIGENSDFVLGPNSTVASLSPKVSDPLLPQNTVVDIQGTVTGDVDLGHDEDRLTVSGTIAGNVTLGPDNDVLTSTGLIGGTVDMGEGNDMILRTGTVGGDVFLGNGFDWIIVQTGDSVAGIIDGGLGTDQLMLATAASGEMLAFDLNQIAGFEHLSLLGAGTVMVSGTKDFDSVNVGGILAGDEDSGGTYQFIGARLETPEFSILGNPADDGQTVLVDADSQLTITGNLGIQVGASNSSLQNDGIIEAAGAGINVGFFTPFSFNNSGTFSAGLVGLFAEPASDISVQNAGEITAPVALMLGAGNDSVINSGSISGDIFLGAGADILENSGSILGIVDGGDDIDTLVNLLGSSITGGITNFENITSAGAITLAPQMGPLIVPGNLDLQADASLNLAVAVGEAAPIQVGGVATLAGNVAVQIILSPDVEIFSGDRFPIVTADGGIAGQFDNLDFATNVFLTATLVQGANGVELELVRTSFLLPFFDASRRGIARALDAVAQAMPQGAKAQGVAADYIHLLTFTPRQQAGTLIDRLQTQFSANVATPVIEARQGFLSELAERSDKLSRLRGASQRWITTVVGFGEFASGTGVDFTTGGAMSITAYKPQENAIVGLAVAGSGSALRERQELGSGGHTSLDMAAFAGLRADRLFVSATGGVNYTEVDTKRRLLIGDIDGFGRGKASGVGYSASIDARYAMNAAGFQIVPQAALRIANFHHGSFTERGLDELGLTVNGRSITSIRAIAGANIEYAFRTNGGSILTPAVGAFFEREIGDSNRDLVVGFIGDPSAQFTLNGLAADRSRVRLTSGLTSSIGENTTVGIRYEAAIGNQYTTHRLIGGLRFRW